MSVNYVLSLSACVADPKTILNLTDGNINIPEDVYQKLEQSSFGDSPLADASRIAGRILCDLSSHGSLRNGGIPRPNGTTVKIVSLKLNGKTCLPNFDLKNPNHQILQTASQLQEESHMDSIIISDNDFLTIDAKALKIPVIAPQSVEYHDNYLGYRRVFCLNQKYRLIANRNDRSWILDPKAIYAYDQKRNQNITIADSLVTNEFLILTNELNERQVTYGRFDGDKIVALKYEDKTYNDLTPRNTNQIFLQEALVIKRGEQRLVIVEGPAGTGKTILPLAIGSHLVTEGVIDQVYFCRANIESDERFGFLPGDIDDKFRGFLAPAMDNLHALYHTPNDHHRPKHKDGRKLCYEDSETILGQYRINPLPLNFLRGRSISHAMIIVDEAQHLTKEQAKLVVTRADTGTIVVLAGDNSQNDNHKLNRFNNGLIHAWETMANLPLTWRIRFSVNDVVRSQLAHFATKKM